MQPIGIVRKIDQLGRVVLPKEMRTHLDLHPGTSVEIFLTESGIFLRPQKSESKVISLPKGRISGIRM